PVAGVDYKVIEAGQPFQPVVGKIEVAEVFGYTCPPCASFEPVVESWLARRPAGVSLALVPGAFDADSTPYARALLTANDLGARPTTSAATFRAIHVARRLPVNTNVGASDRAPSLAKRVVDAKRFPDTVSSFGIDAIVNRARQC